MAGIDVSTSLPRKYEQWSEDVPTAWASPMFTSPFGEGNLISDFQWANPGNNSDEFCRASPHVSLEELGHGLEASDNVNSLLLTILFVMSPIHKKKENSFGNLT